MLTPVGLRPPSVSKTDLRNLELIHLFYGLTSLTNEQKLNPAAQFFRILTSKGRKSSVIQIISDFLHQLVIEIKIVHNTKPHSQHFLCHKQMANVRTGITTAYWTIALRIDGIQILCISLANTVSISLFLSFTTLL